MKQAIRLEIKDRRILNSNKLWKRVKDAITSLPDGIYAWQMPTIFRNNRSLQQNSYYFGVVCKIAGDETGYTEKEMHQEFAREFLTYEKNGKTFVKSTTELNTKEFEDYMSECRRFAGMELSCFIPLPNEKDNFYYDIG